MEWLPGQKVRSQLEPDLGAGTISQVQGVQWIEVNFLKSQVIRRYSTKNPPIISIKFGNGELVRLISGATHRITSIKQHLGLMCYKIEDGRWVVENEIDDTAQAQGAEVKLFRGEWSKYKAFRLRLRLLRATYDFHDNQVMGMRSARVDLHPHQLYLASSLASRWTPRAILADEVGLGKTIEAGLILSALHARGFAQRCLIACPESLQFQWLSELYRRFAISATLLLDEDLQESNVDSNLFEESAILIVSHELLQKIYLQYPKWFEQTEWDLCIIDEAHRFTRPLSNTTKPDAELQTKNAIETVCEASKGALLLTASPLHRGVYGLYQLLRALDSFKYQNFASFQNDMATSKRLAPIAQKLYSETYDALDLAQLRRNHSQDIDLIHSIEKLEKTKDPDELLRKLSDRHFLGRYFFQNRRERLLGFPKRQINTETLYANEQTKAEYLELYKNLSQNPNFEDLHKIATSINSTKETFLGFHQKSHWLISKLKLLGAKNKALVIVSRDQDAKELHKLLVEHLHTRIGLFHSQMNMVERDKQAAWFSDEQGAQIMVASEIGGEGRNFQMASHLFMLDLPENPETIEQRIGRLDRLGQKFPIHIHICAIKNTPEDIFLSWCDLGVSMLRAPSQGVMAIFEKVQRNILEVYLESKDIFSKDLKIPHPLSMQKLLKMTHIEQANWISEVRNSSNVLIDLNSFREPEGRKIKTILESQTTQNTVLGLTQELMNHFGIENEELDRADVLRLQATSQMFIEEYPELPLDQDVVVSTRRTLCLEREDYRFLSPDHPIFSEGMDLFLRSHQGQASCSEILDERIATGLYVHCVFTLSEAIPIEIKGLVQMEPIDIVLNARGDSLDWTEYGDLKTKDWSAELELNNIEDIQAPLEDLIETAKTKTQIIFKRRLEESLSKAIKITRDKQSQFKYLESIGQKPHTSEVLSVNHIVGRIEALRNSAKPCLDSIAVLLKS